MTKEDTQCNLAPGLMMLSFVARFGFFTMFHQVTVTTERTKPRKAATATAVATNQMTGGDFSGSDSNCRQNTFCNHTLTHENVVTTYRSNNDRNYYSHSLRKLWSNNYKVQFPFSERKGN